MGDYSDYDEKAIWNRAFHEARTFGYDSEESYGYAVGVVSTLRDTMAITEVNAARLEMQQAERDYLEAFRAFKAAPFSEGYGSKLDYAVWSTAAYIDSAVRAYEGL